ncbi:hypothetical protein AFEL58S_01962 [Afipia felis]
MTFFMFLFLISFLAGCVAALSVIYPLRFLGVKTRTRALQLLAASLIVMVIAALGQGETPSPTQAEVAEVKLPDVAPAPATPVKLVASEPAQPSAQKRLIEIVESSRSQFSQAKNDLAKGATRPARAKAICAIIRPGQTVRDWIGKVYKLSSNGDGHGVLYVEIADDIKVVTVNNALANAAYPSLIEGSSPLMQTASTLSEGQKIRFSGRFFKGDADCLAELSLTQKGSMQSPDFIFRFTAINPL